VETVKFGGIRTEQGPAGYVLQSGEGVTLSRAASVGSQG
jgi:hypothetical protein